MHQIHASGWLFTMVGNGHPADASEVLWSDRGHDGLSDARAQLHCGGIEMVAAKRRCARRKEARNECDCHEIES